MNREIKFRAWDILSKKLFYPNEHGNYNVRGFDIVWTPQGFMEIEVSVWSDPIEIEYTKEPSITDNVILMQYTGLKDSEGKEIYEGDILFNEADKYNYAIEWNNLHACWQIGSGGYPIGKYQLHEFWEVIGNIFEHPDLLKGYENPELLEDK